MSQKRGNMDDENENQDYVKHLEALRKILLLGVAYASNIGGTGTLTGTSPNMIFKGFMDTYFPDSEEITYGSWMAFNIPPMILTTIAAWLILQLLYIPCWRKQDPEAKERIQHVINAKYEEIGRMSFHEGSVLGLFILLVLLWVFREPKFMPGWADLLNSGKKIGDAVPAIGVFVLMFILPAEPWQIHKSPPLLKWDAVQHKLPWGLVLLLGGGYAMAQGAKESGLSDWMIHKMEVFSRLPPAMVLFIVYLITNIITEVLSNSAATAIFLPVVAKMAIEFHINPISLMLPVTIASSYSMMLPVATGPNAIVFATGHLRTIDMVKAGLILKIISCAIELLMINTLGDYLFHLETFPTWANESHTPITEAP